MSGFLKDASEAALARRSETATSVHRSKYISDQEIAEVHVAFDHFRECAIGNTCFEQNYLWFFVSQNPYRPPI